MIVRARGGSLCPLAIGLFGLLAGGCAKNPPEPATPEAVTQTDAELEPGVVVESITELPGPSEIPSEPSPDVPDARGVVTDASKRQLGPRIATYYLSAGDEIRISVYGYSELDRTLRVPPDGNIYYPALGEMHVDGLSIPQLRERVTEGLSSAAEQRISIGDRIFVTVYRQNLDTVTVVPSSGRVNLPLAGEVELAGLTVDEANRAIAESLARYVLRPSVSTTIQSSALPGPITNPHVAVEVLRFGGHKILVLGEVERPGVYLDQGGSRLLEIVTLAGGPTRHAKMGNVALIRPATETSAPHSMVVNLESAIESAGFSDNPPVQRGDVIYVPTTTIANVAQFFEYVYAIVRPIVTIESGIWLGRLIEEGAGRVPNTIIFQ